MKKLILLLMLTAFARFSSAQSLYFPPLTGSSWDTIHPASLGWCDEKIDSLINYLDQQNTKSFLLLKDGKIVLEHYFDNFGRDSLWYWASAGKTLTAFTVGIAQQEGFLSINDTSSNYLGTGWTVCPPNKEEKITIRNQLTMTSGLNDGVPDHYCTLDTCLQYLADAGTRWAYHNGPYTMLDGVITGATGQNLNQYFAAKVRNQIGMNGAFYPSGYNNVYVSNSRSMARFGLLMLNEGNWNGTQIMTDAAYFQQMINTSQNLNRSYGYLWWLNGKSSFMVPTLQTVFPTQLCPDAPADMYAALGKDGQILNVVPSQNLILVRMGEAPTGSSEVTIVFNNDIWKKLNDLSCTGTSTVALPLKTDCRIFPNPAKNELNISADYPINFIELYNLNGQKILEINNLNSNNATIPLFGIPAGTYMLRINNGLNITVYKIIVNE